MRAVSSSIVIFATLVALQWGHPSAHAQPASMHQTVYVWDFATRSRQKNDLTAKFTHEFEAALVEHGNYRVLERRHSDRWLAQADNERVILDILQVSNPSIKKLQAAEADMVIFGEVFDDVASGQINVTVTFQAFDGSKTLMRSVLLPRGRATDAQNRQELMRKLVEKVRAEPPVYRVDNQGFIFELKKCQATTGGSVRCKFAVTNNEHDRIIKIDSGTSGGYRRRTYGRYMNYSTLYDNLNREAVASKVEMLGTSGDYIEHRLLTGRPVDFAVHFHGISPRASSIARLYLRTGNFSVEFASIPLTKS